MSNINEHQKVILDNIFGDISKYAGITYPNGNKASSYIDFSSLESTIIRNYLIFANQHNYIAFYSFPHFYFSTHLFKFLEKCLVQGLLSGDLHFYNAYDLDIECRDFKLPCHRKFSEPKSRLDLYLISNFYNSFITHTNASDCLLVSEDHRWIFCSDHDYSIYIFFDKTRFDLDYMCQHFSLDVELLENVDADTGSKYLYNHNDNYSYDEIDEAHDIEEHKTITL